MTVFFKGTIFGQALDGAIDPLKERLVALAQTDAHADTKKLFIKDLGTDELESRSARLVQKADVTLHGIGHDDIDAAILQIKIHGIVALISKDIGIGDFGLKPVVVSRGATQSDFDVLEGGHIDRIIGIERFEAGSLSADEATD